MLVPSRYIGLTFKPVQQNFPMFTTSFQKKIFHSESLIRTFQEWIWIKSMSRIISSLKGVDEQMIYLSRWTIQPLFTGKLVVPKLPR